MSSGKLSFQYPNCSRSATPEVIEVFPRSAYADQSRPRALNDNHHIGQHNVGISPQAPYLYVSPQRFVPLSATVL